jgi:outer membrane murein-binding lipoprotein Lpp
MAIDASPVWSALLGAAVAVLATWWVTRQLDKARRREQRSDDLAEKVHTLDVRITRLETHVQALLGEGRRQIKGGGHVR